MTESHSSAPAPDELDEGQVLEWITHPMKRRPIVALLVGLFILFVSFAIFTFTESEWMSALALLVLFASVAKFYLPTTYRLSDRGVTVKSTTQTIRKTWSQFRSCYPDKNGVLLSPFAEPSRLENFRGQYLIFADNRDEVMAFVRPRLNTDWKGSTGVDGGAA